MYVYISEYFYTVLNATIALEIMKASTQEKLKRASKVLLELIVIVIVASVAASFASQAAFPRLATVELSEEDYWQGQEDSTKPLAKQSETVLDAEVTAEEVLLPTFSPPAVSAKSYIVADIVTGEIFAQKNPIDVFPIASITKLMTAVLASETIDANSQIVVSAEAAETYGAAGGLRAGDVLTLESLYYPLLLESSNDAAVAIAEHADFTRFLGLMNRKALVLDMGSTRFRDPSGLADENTSSARDLVQLARYIYAKKPFILDLTTKQQALAPRANSDALHNFTNNNPMVGRSDFLGGKNGYTDKARRTLLSIFTSEIAGEKRDVVIIVLGSETHSADTLALLLWLSRAF